MNRDNPNKNSQTPTTGVTCACGTVNKRKRWTNKTVLKCTNCKAEIKYVWAKGWQNVSTVDVS